MRPLRGTLGMLAVAATALALAGVPWAASAQDVDADADALPNQGTTLEPGRYHSSAVGPSIEFRADEGWAVGVTPPGPIFTLERTDQPGTVVTVTRFDGDAFLDSCDSTSLAVVEGSVLRLAEIIAGNPYLNPGPPSAIEVDGHPGIQLDAAVPPYTECHLPFVLLWALPIGEGGEFVQVADQQSRFILLDVEGDVIVVAIESFPGVPFGGLLEASIDLVDSMRIEPGDYIPPEPQPTPAATEPPAADAGSSPAPSAASA
jgi:hypothetical protein